MNNTKKILLITAIASLLIMGTNIIPIQSYADTDDKNIKKNSDFDSKLNANSVTEENGANQHTNQDNFCC
jgi:hypothetical protein